LVPEAAVNVVDPTATPILLVDLAATIFHPEVITASIEIGDPIPTYTPSPMPSGRVCEVARVENREMIAARQSIPVMQDVVSQLPTRCVGLN
jgi:hypothetical protein